MTTRTTSIARRIAWRFQWKRLGRILFQAAALLCVCAAVWCVATAQAAGALTQMSDWYIRVNDLTYVRGQGLLPEAVIFHMGAQTADMSLFLFWLIFALGCLTALRLILWLFSCLRATERIRKYLRPIDDIAQVTESISAHGFDESKFQSLEDAIDHLNGVSPDEELNIGDDDLVGLETAVNNLIARMRRGYRQQVQFVDDASHELRTPIAVIQGYADMLARWGSTDEKVLQESIQAIQTETEHMKTLVEQLLFLARGESGRQTLNMAGADLAALTAEVFEESRMIDPDHEYILRRPEGPVSVRMDVAMLKQAVRILADNARKYSPLGARITFRTYIRDGESACVDVQDNGVGIAREDVPRIFDRFYRAGSARTDGVGGSGLGLSIARWIVSRHGGRFEVTSWPGVGTRITILLRLLASREEASGR